MIRNPVEQTQHLLADIPRLWRQLPSTRYMVRLRDDTNIRKPVAGSRPPLDTALLDLKDGRDITWWVNLAIEEMIEAEVEPENTPSTRNPDLAEQCAWLAANTPWIAEHNPDYHAEISSLHWMYRRAAGRVDSAKLRCLSCGNRAFIDGEWLICTEVEEHARTVKDIEHEHRFRNMEPTSAICQRYGINEDRIHQWRQRHKLAPADRQGRNLYWWPWDVFCLINPTVAEAINARDEHTTKETA